MPHPLRNQLGKRECNILNVRQGVRELECNLFSYCLLARLTFVRVLFRELHVVGREPAHVA